jgi:predicted metal-dependent hydrolase
MEANQDPRLFKGIQEFNQGLYFECHESLEEVWLEEHGADREFYQGIIQIAAGYYKWQQGVLAGAVKLWTSGLEKIGRYGPAHLGVELDCFVRGVKENLKRVEAARQKGEGPPELKIPVLGPIP